MQAPRARQARPLSRDRATPARGAGSQGGTGSGVKWLRRRDCDTPLTNPESQRLGYGRSCAEKRGLIPRRRRRRASPAVRRPKPATAPAAPDALPGQTELDLYFHQPTLESL
ncbi:DUF6011 domain-containing protein [Streptomyces bluensis]|uniref:DUF6011 domain-containing protein n=1 Tax=Streptomyces bluensis TaxID=33897 RepID=UPI00331767A3